ncbi:MAG: hypothetical protein IKG42_04815 [Clostridia bacterium]|nr:hypothetical protein [Clostridia bacterium]
MTSDQIIKDASSETDFKDYTLLDMQLSLLIKQILKMYFNHQISKEEAQRYKLQAVKKYEMDKKNYEFQKDMFQQHVNNIRDTEELRIKLRKKLNEQDPVTEERLSEILNIALEIIEITYKEDYK